MVLSTPGLSVRMVGLDVTHSCRMTAAELESLRGKSTGFVSRFLIRGSKEKKKKNERERKKNSLSFISFSSPHPF